MAPRMKQRAAAKLEQPGWERRTSNHHHMGRGPWEGRGASNRHHMGRGPWDC